MTVKRWPQQRIRVIGLTHLIRGSSFLLTYLLIRIPFARRTSTAEVIAVSGCPHLSSMAMERCLRFFCKQIARSASHEHHHCAVAAAIRKPPSIWLETATRKTFSNMVQNYWPCRQRQVRQACDCSVVHSSLNRSPVPLVTVSPTSSDKTCSE